MWPELITYISFNISNRLHHGPLGYVLNFTGYTNTSLPRELSWITCTIPEWGHDGKCKYYYSDVIRSGVASQITSLTIVYSNGYSGTNQRKHQSSTSPAFVRGIHRWPVNSLHKGPVTWTFFFSIWWRHHCISMFLAEIHHDKDQFKQMSKDDIW